MQKTSEELAEDRMIMKGSYIKAVKDNKDKYNKGNIYATSELVYNNQKEDALRVMNAFNEKEELRLISIIKEPKQGANGFMTQLSYLFGTHPDDNKIIPYDQQLFITGGSNKSWKDELTQKLPSVLINQVYHNGTLQNISNINNYKLIIIDENHIGNKPTQKLDKTLDQIFNIDYIIQHNIKIVLISATNKNEIDTLEKWDDQTRHEVFKMTKADNYIGVKEFYEKGVIKHWYDMKDETNIRKWIDEDIIGHYKNDHRLHFIRIKNEDVRVVFERVAKEYGIICKYHTSEDKITNWEDELRDLEYCHKIILIIDLLRYATLIPNKIKLKIGAMHENYCISPDTNTLIQGFPGRVCGYWKDEIFINNHKIGPIRIHMDSLKEYIDFIDNPKGSSKYSSRNKKNIYEETHFDKSKVKAEAHKEYDFYGYLILKELKEVEEKSIILKYSFRKPQTKDDNGCYKTSLTGEAKVQSFKDIESNLHIAIKRKGVKGVEQFRTYMPFYENKKKETESFILFIRTEEDAKKLAEDIQVKIVVV